MQRECNWVGLAWPTRPAAGVPTSADLSRRSSAKPWQNRAKSECCALAYEASAKEADQPRAGHHRGEPARRRTRRAQLGEAQEESAGAVG